MTQEVYERLASHPFTKQEFIHSIKIDPIVFNLAKDNKLVTLLTINDYKTLPVNLIEVLREEFNYVIEEGRTYPHIDQMNYQEFVDYLFAGTVCILLDGDFSGEFSQYLGKETEFWKQAFLGEFYIKPNYIGRCSHACNGGFVVNHSKRGLGLGKELGQKYLEIAPKLGYVYSVFNLVFETNIASMKIWDSLGFQRIGYIPKVAHLKGCDKLVGAYMYGYDFQ